MKIQKPLLAGKFNSEKAKFPYAATPKIDGIRFLIRTCQPLPLLLIVAISVSSFV